MPLRHILLALVVVAIWGFNFVVIKLSVEAMPPILAAGLRFLAAAVPMVFLVKPPKAPWWIIIAHGLAFGFALYAFLNLSISWGMPAGLSSVVLQTQAFFTMAIAFAVLGERPGRYQILGAVIAFTGIGVMAFERAAGAGLSALGLTILAAISWGLANVLTKQAGRVNAVAFTAWSALVSPIPLFGLSLLIEGWPAVSAALAGFGWNDALLIAFLAYPATLLGGGIWAWLLGRHPASVVAPFTLLVPITGLASGYLVLGERVTPLEIAGGVLIIAGIVVTLLKRQPIEPPVRSD